MSKEKFIEALSSTGRKGLDTVIAKLEESGFFDAPASSKFHLSCKGGLMEHSMNVYEAALFVRDQIIRLRKACLSASGLLQLSVVTEGF